MTDIPGVPLLDIGRENGSLWTEFQAAIAKLADSGRFVLGPDCTDFEQRMAELTCSKFAIGCASGSDALLLSLIALNIGPGDEVIVPSFTFFATASAVWRLGAKPVFVDIEPKTFNINAEVVAAAIRPATKAIIPVHLYGQCAPLGEILRVAAKHEIPVIEDAAQAVGASFQSRPAGSLGTLGCFSFYPTKNLGAWGDGGMLTTSDTDLNKQLRLLRGHGMHPRYFHSQVGINSRLDSLQAAILNIKLNHLSSWTEKRRENAARYQQLFRQARLDEYIELPIESPDGEHVWNQFTIRVRDGRRDALRLYLTAANVGTEIYYPVPLHRQDCFSTLGYEEGSLPETEKASSEVLSIPIFPGLTAEEQEIVVGHISKFFSVPSHDSTISPISVDAPLDQPLASG